LANSQQESIQAFLEQIKATNVEYQAIVVIWDNYLSHKSAKVKAAAVKLGIYLVYLPPYSPDLNPEEYLWKSMKRELSKDFIKTEGHH
jgi:transposase